MLEKLKKEADGVLVLDAGDDLCGPAVPPQQKTLRAQTILDGFARLGVAAMALGERDREVDVGVGRIPRRMRARVAGIEVAAFTYDLEPPDARPGAVNPGPELRRLAEAERKAGAQLVVALIHGGFEPAKTALKAAAPSGISFAFTSHGWGPSQPEQVAGAWLAQCPPQGKQFCQLDLHVLDGKLDFADAGPRAQIQGLLAGQRQAIADVDGRETSSRAELRDYYEKQKAQLRQQIADGEKRLAETTRPITGSWLEGRQTPLGTEVADDPTMNLLLLRYKSEVARLPPPPPAPTMGYLGADTCRGCHPSAYATWKQTRHARAFASLAKTHQEKDQACVRCHVTGPSLMPDVQCEACHGPGMSHSNTPHTKGQITRNPAESVCVACHTRDQTGGWEFASFRKAVLGPGHGAVAAAHPPRR